MTFGKMTKGLALAAAAVAVFGFANPMHETQKIMVKHTVRTGQTMYGIAMKLAWQYGDKRDIREIVYDAKVASHKYRDDKDGNRYFNSIIHPGEELIYVLEVDK